MRDPERIDRILAKLGKAWHAAPDLRLGQLIYNLTFGGNALDPYYTEDGPIEKALDRMNARKG
jgi:hypothetical protein